MPGFPATASIQDGGHGATVAQTQSHPQPNGEGISQSTSDQTISSASTNSQDNVQGTNIQAPISQNPSGMQTLGSQIRAGMTFPIQQYVQQNCAASHYPQRMMMGQQPRQTVPVYQPTPHVQVPWNLPVRQQAPYSLPPGSQAAVAPMVASQVTATAAASTSCPGYGFPTTFSLGPKVAGFSQYGDGRSGRDFTGQQDPYSRFPDAIPAIDAFKL